MTRLQTVIVKTKTDFGSLHFHADFDEMGRIHHIEFKTHDDLLTEESQIGKLLHQVCKAINDQIEHMNTPTAHSFDLKAIAGRTGQ